MRYVAIVGGEEAVSLKEMESGEQRELSPDEVIPSILRGVRSVDAHRRARTRYRDSWCGELTAERAGTAGAGGRLGAPPPRPRRA